jgi:Zn-dependent protease
MLFNLLPAPSILISYIIVLMTAFAVHEFAHAYVASRFGDRTPELNGRLTLNPLAHLDVMGSLMLLVAGFGWAKPVPVNLYALERRSRWAPMWVALAGPLSNLGMAILAAIPFQIGLVSFNQAMLGMVSAQKHIMPTIPQLLFIFVETNLLLMLFNLIPVAPLDGEKILYYLLPPGGQRVMEQIRPYGPIILLVLVFSSFLLPGQISLVGAVISPIQNLLLRLLVG